MNHAKIIINGYTFFYIIIIVICLFFRFDIAKVEYFEYVDPVTKYISQYENVKRYSVYKTSDKDYAELVDLWEKKYNLIHYPFYIRRLELKDEKKNR